ncbi:hypothetical protein BGW38_002166 [Lunasporangiospora selenospora]|uniref:Uncharacterized protein n=1 Tax=Lunasporangiospora selenospora TaxID=979761 RepID=A0A9P6FT33_9FUNG|nr:hypothetical protein BGW38_002166 [Lunasporangiospora selenospora]
MMNDIVCIDLRQKILGVIPRMGHLERRLLKKFEQDYQDTLSKTQSNAPVATATSCAAASNTAAATTVTTIEQDEASSPSFVGTDGQLMENKDAESDDHEGEDEDGEYGYKQEDDEDEDDESKNDLEFDHGSRMYTTFYRRGAAQEPGQQQRQPHQLLDRKLTGPPLRKKNSHEDDLTQARVPECQSNQQQQLYSSNPISTRTATSFSKQGAFHVRRCSSTDGLRSRPDFAMTTSVATPGQRPIVPPRSDKRSSMMVLNSGSIRVNGIRSYASERDEDEGEGEEEVRRNNRLANRRTMSFESRGSLNLASLTESRSELGSELGSRKGVAVDDLPPTPRASFEQMSISSGSQMSLDAPLSASSTLTSPTTISTSSQSSSPICPSMMSSAFSTPFTSPLLMSPPQMGPVKSNCGKSVGEAQQQQQQSPSPNHSGLSHGHSSSLTSIVTASTSTTIDATFPPRSSSANSLRTFSNMSGSCLGSSPISGAQSAPLQMQILIQSQQNSTSSSMTLSSTSSPTIATPAGLQSSHNSGNCGSSGNMWTKTTTTSTKKTGLLRKIRSKPKMKDQMFDMVVAAAPAAAVPQSS